MRRLAGDCPGGVRMIRRTVGRLALLVAVVATIGWVDRVVRGSVVDFINVGVGPLRTGIFNVADVAILLGVTVLLLASPTADAPSTEKIRGGP